MFKRKIRIER